MQVYTDDVMMAVALFRITFLVRSYDTTEMVRENPVARGSLGQISLQSDDVKR